MLDTVHYFLLPGHKNDYKAKVIQKTGILGLIAVIISFQFLNQIGAEASILGYAANIDVFEVVELTNQERAGIGESQLTYSTELSEAARKKGLHMLEQDYWSHVGPDGTEPWFFFHDVGYTYKYAGENLARDFSNTNSAINAWMASSSHRENMLSDKYTEIGVAVVEGDLNGEDTTIIVQLFGTRSDIIPSVPVASAQDEQSVVPEVSIANAQEQEQINGKIQYASHVSSPFITTQSFYIVLLGLLLAVMIADIFVVERRGITRIGGRSFAHMSFIALILILIILAESGEIL